MMTKQLIVAAFVVSVVSVAWADQAGEGPTAAAISRAQVVEELRRAQADSSAASYGFLGLYNPAGKAAQLGQVAEPEIKGAPMQAGKSRAEVRAELSLAQDTIKVSRGQRSG